MPHKKLLDELKWNPSAEEIELRRSIQEHVNNNNWDKVIELQGRLKPIETSAVITVTGLYHPLFRAFSARAEWELLKLSEEYGSKLVDEYSLHPNGQNGIGLDFKRLNERMWIPADYFNDDFNTKNERSIFDDDESNYMFTSSGLNKKLISNIFEGRRSENRIQSLVNDKEWQAKAKEYSKALLECSLERGIKEIDLQYLPIFKDLILEYKSQMR